MTGPILAQVRRVLIGHSERALIHAVDDAGLEYKIEVPSSAVHGTGERILFITWSLHTLPGGAEHPQPSQAEERPVPAVPAPAQTPSENDQEFMALMSRGRGDTSVTASTTAAETKEPSTTAPAQQLAALLGMHTGRSG